jgi:hypothetical protein
MFELIDIVGFRVTTTTDGYIEKFYDLKTKKNVYILVFTGDFVDDDVYYFKKEIKSISRFFNLLKNNGSSVITRYSTGEMILIGKKLEDIKKDVELYELIYYNEVPFIQLDEMGDMEDTTEPLKNIFGYMSFMGIDLDIFD